MRAREIVHDEKRCHLQCCVKMSSSVVMAVDEARTAYYATDQMEKHIECEWHAFVWMSAMRRKRARNENTKRRCDVRRRTSNTHSVCTIGISSLSYFTSGGKYARKDGNVRLHTYERGRLRLFTRNPHLASASDVHTRVAFWQERALMPRAPTTFSSCLYCDVARDVCTQNRKYQMYIYLSVVCRSCAGWHGIECQYRYFLWVEYNDYYYMLL